MTTNDIDAIRKLANAADDGPWTAHDDGLVWAERIGDPVSGSAEQPNAEFIAAARQIVPALCDEVEQLRTELDRERRAHVCTVRCTPNSHVAFQGRQRVTELEAELAKADAQLTAANRRADGLDNDLRSAVKANTRFADQLTDTGKHPCDCCYVHGSTIRCGRAATTDTTVMPYGYLNVSDVCAARINGKPAEAVAR